MPYFVSHPTTKLAHDGRTFSFGEEVTHIEKLVEGELENLVNRGILSEQQPQGAVHAAAASLNPTALRPESGYAEPVTAGNAPQSDPFQGSASNNHDELEAEDESRQQAQEPQNFAPVDQVQQPAVQPQVQQPQQDSGI